MRKIFFIVILVSFGITSCKNEATPVKNSVIETNLANNQKVYKAFETGDRAVLDSFISNEAVDHSGPNGTTISSGDSIKTMLADMHNHVKDLSFTIISAAANEEYIFTYSQMKGTATDSAWGMAPGTKIDQKAVDVVRVKDGKMVEHWGFVDQNEMMKQMQSMKTGN